MPIQQLRIVNCFGFLDSGHIELSSPGNFIYVLGRNSSGKTALLNALDALTGNAPESHPNFKNYTSTEDEPFIEATLNVQFEKAKFLSSLWQFLADRLGNNPKQLRREQQIPTFVDELTTVYQPLFESKLLSVRRRGNGDYSFVPSIGDSTTAVRDEAAREVANRFFSDGVVRIRSNNHKLNFVPQEIENLVATQLPPIRLFGASYLLKDELPDHIDSSMLDTPPNKLTSNFLGFLGIAEVTRFLSTNDPDEKRQLDSGFRERLSQLGKRIAGSQSPDSARQLVDFDLYNLRLTTKTDGKKCFYRHLSERTKLLIGYLLDDALLGSANGILLFDEPNTGLHPSAQKLMLEFLKSLTLANNLVVVTTHSEYLIDLNLLPGVRIMGSDERGHLKVNNHPYRSARASGDHMALQPVLDAIGLEYGNRLDWKDKLVVVEGITDFLFLKGFKALLAHDAELNLIPARSASQIASLVPLLIAQGTRFKVVLDAGEGTATTLENDFGISGDFVKSVEVPEEFAGRIRTAGIEDLFSRRDYLEILRNADQDIDSDHIQNVSNGEYAKRTHKRIVAERFLQMAHHGNWRPDAVTAANFREVLDFCSSEPWFTA